MFDFSRATGPPGCSRAARQPQKKRAACGAALAAWHAKRKENQQTKENNPKTKENPKKTEENNRKQKKRNSGMFHKDDVSVVPWLKAK